MNARPRKPLRDIAPRARLASLQFDGYSQYQLLVKTIRRTFFTSGRFPAWLVKGCDFEGRQHASTFITDLVEQGVSLGVSLLGQVTQRELFFLRYVWGDDAPEVRDAARFIRHTDGEVIAGAKSIARRLIRQTKIERRWCETVKGKQVRKSRAEMRQVHPVLGVNSDGEEDWISPVDDIECDISGARIAGLQPIFRNATESFLVADLDRRRTMFKMLDVVGSCDLCFMLDYIEHGKSRSSADRQRFARLKKRIRASHDLLRKTVILMKGRSVVGRRLRLNSPVCVHSEMQRKDVLDREMRRLETNAKKTR